MDRRRSTRAIPRGPKPKFNAVVASASRITKGRRVRPPKSERWQKDAWDFYDSCGELRFAVGWIANGLSRVNLVAARKPIDGHDPIPLRRPAAEHGPGGNEGAERQLSPVEEAAVGLVNEIGGGIDGQAQMLARLATLLTVAGIGWLLIEPTGSSGEQWAWRVLSDDELKDDNGTYKVATSDDDDTDEEWRDLRDDHVLIKVWRSHPRRSREPDSAVRALLGVLGQLRKIDQHIEATADSRLAGAGLLIVPEEVKFAKAADGANAPDDATGDVDEDEPATVDDFMETLTDAMVTPIGDRGVAASVVPLAITVPGEHVDKVRHITFWSEFSDTAIALSERAVKRLALGLDMPPEVVTGLSSMNHWGAWRVQEEAITLHIHPLAEIICYAITTGFLRPALEAMEFTAEEASSVLVTADISDLVSRPDRSSDAFAAYENLELSGEALRREAGLSEDDKPSDEEFARRWALRMADRNPNLAPAVAKMLGLDLPELAAVQQYPERSLDGRRAEPVEPAGAGAPDTNDDPPADPDRQLSAAALFEACDAIVFRALERAGQRLRNKAAKGQRGGSAVLAAHDPTMLHTTLDATSFATFADLLDGALDRVPAVASRIGVDADKLGACLNGYLRDLISKGQAHDPAALEATLRPLVAA